MILDDFLQQVDHLFYIFSQATVASGDLSKSPGTHRSQWHLSCQTDLLVVLGNLKKMWSVEVVLHGVAICWIDRVVAQTLHLVFTGGVGGVGDSSVSLHLHIQMMPMPRTFLLYF